MWGRKGVGIELNSGYYNIAQKRIRAAKVPVDKEVSYPALKDLSACVHAQADGVSLPNYDEE